VVDYSRIPHEPGCYLFKDASGRIIYVGKAKDLRKRVSSYFLKDDLDPKTSALVAKISSLDYVVTSNEQEALILENTLIKKHQPHYNIDLKDSKKYAYILLTEEIFPRLMVARKKIEKGEYFGPFVSAERRDAILRFANNVFRLRTCKKLPKRVCLRHQMGRCTAPCVGEVSQKEYLMQVADARRLLSGKESPLLEDLRTRMQAAAKKQDYEGAKVLRDQITALESLQEKQRMETQKRYDQDIINYVVDSDVVHLAVFKAHAGILSEMTDFEFPQKEEFLEEFILQYYSEEPVPKEVILPEKIPVALLSFLEMRRGGSVDVTVPLRGEKKDLLELVKKNVEKSFKEGDLDLADLQEKLGLEKKPKTIECFDVSHISGSDSVGSMVRFVDGRPDKSGYRRFKIRSIEGIDDPAMMAELVRRRYTRIKEENGDFPDLIVVDGGSTQLSAAFGELRKLKVKIPIIGLAKKNEEVYFPGFAEPVSFDRKSRAVLLLQNVRDEAHRFAIKYHKILRKKRTLKEE
jgi:excinuclease ABC subunit C